MPFPASTFTELAAVMLEYPAPDCVAGTEETLKLAPSDWKAETLRRFAASDFAETWCTEALSATTETLNKFAESDFALTLSAAAPSWTADALNSAPSWLFALTFNAPAPSWIAEVLRFPAPSWTAEARSKAPSCD